MSQAVVAMASHSTKMACWCICSQFVPICPFNNLQYLVPNVIMWLNSDHEFPVHNGCHQLVRYTPHISLCVVKWTLSLHREWDMWGTAVSPLSASSTCFPCSGSWEDHSGSGGSTPLWFAPHYLPMGCTMLSFSADTSMWIMLNN